MSDAYEDFGRKGDLYTKEMFDRARRESWERYSSEEFDEIENSGKKEKEMSTAISEWEKAKADVIDKMNARLDKEAPAFTVTNLQTGASVSLTEGEANSILAAFDTQRVSIEESRKYAPKDNPLMDLLYGLADVAMARSNRVEAKLRPLIKP